MKIHAFFITTILSTSIALGMTASYAAETITTDTVKTAADPISKAEMDDPRVAATSFVEHVNFARVALAMKNTDLAKQHIMQARGMVNIIKGAAMEQRIVKAVESGRIVYDYETDYKYHYFPIQTNRVEVKHVENGPMWANNNLAVTDADSVYLTVDVTGDKVDMHLNQAELAIAKNDLQKADDQLAQLTEATVTVDGNIAMPSVKAHDNIALARNFIEGENYEGAAYALKHAHDALDDMQKDDNNATRLAEITAMQGDVDALQDVIAKKDPDMIQKANVKMDKWWNDLKDWGKSKE